MKLLNLQDLHVHQKWIEESKRHIKRVCEVAKAEKVDGITIAGDFFHAPILANDKNSWSDVLQMARDLQEAAPVFYITGTPSHDAPGCYESFKDIGWKEIGIGKSEILGDLLIMGIQELTPAVILAQAPELSKVEAIAKQYELVDTIIDNYYVPLSMNHTGPVHFMAHGHVSGVKFRDDQKPRSSDFMYSEQLLSKIQADYYQFGHIHLPQDFNRIPGGYGGTSHLTWNDLSFVPGFNVVNFDSEPLMDAYTSWTTRFHYGDPMRQKLELINLGDLELSKVIERLENNPGRNIWIDIRCDKSFAEQFDIKASLAQLHEKYDLGPLSKVTCNIQRVENVRVETEEYEKCKTLEDLFKIWDENVNTSTLLKVREAEEATKAEIDSTVHHNFEFLDLYLKGSKAGRENGVDEIKISFDNFQTGANMLTGPNGTGKSFTLGFCTPFSEHLPTGKSFKDLFELKDSQIIRRWSDGSDIITQKILIDPTLSTPSAKYYMDINGESLTADGNKKPFDDLVNDLFGSIKMFMTCAFRGQKENSDFPSLENAKEGDLRKTYAELLDADRVPLKNYAHNKAGEISRAIELDDKEAETLEENKESIEDLNAEIISTSNTLNENKKSLQSNLSESKKLEEKKAIIDSDIAANNSVNDKISDTGNEYRNTEIIVENLTSEKVNLSNILNGSDDLKKELDKLKNQQTEYNTASGEYFRLQGEFNKSVSAWSKDKTAKDQDKQIIQDKAEEIKGQIAVDETMKEKTLNTISSLTAEKGFLNKPCEFCNKISSSADLEISGINNKIEVLEKAVKNSIEYKESLNKRLSGYRADYQSVIDSIPNEPTAPTELNNSKIQMDYLKIDPSAIVKIEATLSGLKDSENRLIEIESLIKTKKELIETLKSSIVGLRLNIKPINQAAYDFLTKQLSDISNLIDSNNTEIGKRTAEIKGLEDRVVKSKEIDVKIEKLRQKTEKQQIDASEWKRIEEAFSPKGIPALELSMLAPRIDREANKLLSSYGSRFEVETITQQLDSRGKDLIEKFKILVHDSMASEVKNLPDMSGGQAVWITKALQEAISKVAIERTGRNWLYSVMDEADAALDSSAIVDFYDMMNRAMDGQRKLVAVSHSLEAQSCISNVYEITKAFVGYGE